MGLWCALPALIFPFEAEKKGATPSQVRVIFYCGTKIKKNLFVNIKVDLGNVPQKIKFELLLISSLVRSLEFTV